MSTNMNNLDGLWKNQSCGLLAHLRQHALRIDSSFYMDANNRVEAGVEVVKGDIMALMSGNANRGRLTSVLPKQDMVIIVTDINRQVDRLGLSVLTINGVVVPNKRSDTSKGLPIMKEDLNM